MTTREYCLRKKRRGGDFMKRIVVVLFCISLCLTLAGTANVAIGQDCEVRVIRDTLPKSHFWGLPVLIRIETSGIEDLNFLTRVKFNCDADGEGLLNSITPTGKIIAPNFGASIDMIWQTVIIWPALLTGNARDDSEMCTVTVDGCDSADEVELNILSLSVPLNE